MELSCGIGIGIGIGRVRGNGSGGFVGGDRVSVVVFRIWRCLSLYLCLFLCLCLWVWIRHCLCPCPCHRPCLCPCHRPCLCSCLCPYLCLCLFGDHGSGLDPSETLPVWRDDFLRSGLCLPRCEGTVAAKKSEKTGRRRKVESGHVGSVFWKMRSGTKHSTGVVSERCQAENAVVSALASTRGRYPNRPQASNIYPGECRRHYVSRHSGLESVSVSRDPSASLG